MQSINNADSPNRVRLPLLGAVFKHVYSVHGPGFICGGNPRELSLVARTWNGPPIPSVTRSRYTPPCFEGVDPSPSCWMLNLCQYMYRLVKKLPGTITTKVQLMHRLVRKEPGRFLPLIFILTKLYTNIYGLTTLSVAR